MLFLAGVVVLLGAAAYGVSLMNADRGTPAAKGLPTPSVLAATGKCVVSYAVREDDGARFRASVTVANRDNVAVKNWNLLFVMQGSQVVSGNGKVALDQQGTMVTVTSSQTLSAQKAVTLDITGRYTDANPAPMAFKLGDQSCETYVSPKPGEPSRPVQRLSNGEVRLGPAVRTPQPGLSIGPGGVVVPVPVPSGQASTSSGPASSGGPSSGPTGGGQPSEEPKLCMQFPADPQCVGPRPPQSSAPASASPSASTETSAPPSDPQSEPPEDVDQGDDTTAQPPIGGGPPNLP
jgi:serine/threonine-protein kinase